MRRITGTFALCLFLACLLPGVARASAEDLANEIAAEIMSPFCPGVTLENCPSERAIALHARIESWARDGWGKTRILDELVDLYGEPIRAVPPASGSGLWAWLAPGVALLAGGALATVLARRWTKKAGPEPGDLPIVAPETRARLAEELDAMRGRP
jgi:cytochrome c-type biogenesis protein CcmH/NrfF